MSLALFLAHEAPCKKIQNLITFSGSIFLKFAHVVGSNNASMLVYLNKISEFFWLEK